MIDSPNSTVDVLVIGGGGAGSAAALQLSRVLRSVVVVDGGEPRNAPATHMHGYLGHDGVAPADFLRRVHDEIRSYGVRVVSDRVVEVDDVSEGANGLVCRTESGRTYRARRVVVATGLRDILPDIPGVREHWGGRVIHCPWCHGWEVRGMRIAVIDTAGMGAHQALIFAQLSERVTLIVDAERGLTDEQRDRLRLGGVSFEERPATSLRTVDGHVTVDLGGDGSSPAQLEVDVAVVAPRFEPNVAMVEHLVDVDDHPSGLGRQVVADTDTGVTSDPRIFAAGNAADPMQQVLHAAAHGSRVATMVNASLIDEDIENARRSESDRIHWNDRYCERDEPTWSGQPNGSLVAQLSGVAPGRALDVGCGEGADAIWLAGQGWQVVATDISTVAIDRAGAAATAAGADLVFAATDALADPPPAASFDLVAMSYPAFERGRGLNAFAALADAVAPDGRLLVIGHVLDDEALHHAAEHGFDPTQFVSLDDIVEIIGTGFTVEFDDVRARPNPPAGSHHSLDRVVVARRTA